MFMTKSKCLGQSFKLLQQQFLLLTPTQKIPQYTQIGPNSNFLRCNLVRSCFATKKPTHVSKPIQKAHENTDKSLEQNQFLWKLSIFLNIVGTGMGFYFPSSALSFVLTSNAMIQMYEGGKSLKVMKQICEKSQNSTPQQLTNSLIDIKSIVKKITLNSIFALTFSISTGYGIINPAFSDYSLIGLNFWIFYNLKLNNFSHGYYLVLISLLVFQYFWFQRVFDLNKNHKNSQKKLN